MKRPAECYHHVVGDDPPDFDQNVSSGLSLRTDGSPRNHTLLIQLYPDGRNIFCFGIDQSESGSVALCQNAHRVICKRQRSKLQCETARPIRCRIEAS